MPMRDVACVISEATTEGSCRGTAMACFMYSSGAPPPPAPADRGRILDQQVVKARALQRARHVDEQLRHHPVVADMPGPALAPGLHTRALQKPAKVKGLRRHLSAPTPWPSHA